MECFWACGCEDGLTECHWVRRILKAFVDAQWLADFDARLATYQAQLAGVPMEDGEIPHE